MRSVQKVMCTPKNGKKALNVLLPFPRIFDNTQHEVIQIQSLSLCNPRLMTGTVKRNLRIYICWTETEKYPPLLDMTNEFIYFYLAISTIALSTIHKLSLGSDVDILLWKTEPAVIDDHQIEDYLKISQHGTSKRSSTYFIWAS